VGNLRIWQSVAQEVRVYTLCERLPSTRCSRCEGNHRDQIALTGRSRCQPHADCRRQARVPPSGIQLTPVIWFQIWSFVRGTPARCERSGWFLDREGHTVHSFCPLSFCNRARSRNPLKVVVQCSFWSRSHHSRRSQKFPDELKRNRQKRTRDTARWILMFLGRLASRANRDEM
jgi:hypothetical protein